VVERPVFERERERIGLQQGRLDPDPRKVSAGEFELLRLDVDADETDTRKFVPEYP
jgi:hypothetical protein